MLMAACQVEGKIKPDWKLDWHKVMKSTGNSKYVNIYKIRFLIFLGPLTENWQLKVNMTMIYWGVYNMYRNKCRKTIEPRPEMGGRQKWCKSLKSG